MSQKVQIERVSIRGAAPFLGLSDNEDPSSTRLYASSGDEVMQWLCSGWRTRFNAYRSRRSRYTKRGELIPIGGTVDERTSKLARLSQSYLAAIPSLVLESPEKLEKQDWFAATKRRATLRKQHTDPGKMPRFRSRKHDDDIFTCWFNKGRNARFEMVNRHHGIVSITGQNPARYQLPGVSGRFTIRIHVRVSQPIREYSSVRVNWTKKTLVFVNDPVRAERSPTGEIVALDRGVVHQLASSQGEVFDLPRTRLAKIDGEIRRRQRAQARAVKASGHETQKSYRQAGPSKRFAAHSSRITELHAQAARIVNEHQHQWSNALVERYDTIITEDLSLAGMTRKPQPKPDALRPGKYLPNGRAAKRGLNRALAGAALGSMQDKLRYKSIRAGVTLCEVDPRYTSQRCAQCGYTAKENRKSQAVFSCVKCAHTDNADLNAAHNILEKGLVMLARQQGGTHPGAGGTLDVARGTALNDAMPMKRKPQRSRT